MTVLDMWYKATGNAVCCRCDCHECHKIYNTNICPTDHPDISQQELLSFIQRVTKAIKYRQDVNGLFGWTITDNDLISILEDKL